MNVTVDLDHFTSNMIEKAEFNDYTIGFKCRITLVDKTKATFHMCVSEQVYSFMKDLKPEQIVNNSSLPSLSIYREVIYNKELKGFGDIFKTQIKRQTIFS